MPGLQAIAVGCESDLLPQLRQELAAKEVMLVSEHGNLLGMFERWANNPEDPKIVIFRLQPDQDLLDLRHCAESFKGWPILALMEPVGDTELMFAVIRAGASQLRTLPIKSDEFHKSLDAVIKELWSAIEVRAATTHYVAIAGANGGCGGTTLALNLGFEITHSFRRSCIIAELALKFGVIAPYLSLQPKYTIKSLLDQADRLDANIIRNALVTIADGPGLLAAPGESFSNRIYRFDEVFQILNSLVGMAEIVVADLPCTYDDLYFETLLAANSVVLVCEQTVASVRAVSLVINHLTKEKPDGTYYLVVNKYDPKLTEFQSDKLRKLLRIPYAFTVALDRSSYHRAEIDGKPLRLINSQSPSLIDIHSLAQVLLGMEGTSSQAPPRKTSLLDRMFRTNPTPGTKR